MMSDVKWTKRVRVAKRHRGAQSRFSIPEHGPQHNDEGCTAMFVLEYQIFNCISWFSDSEEIVFSTYSVIPKRR